MLDRIDIKYFKLQVSQSNIKSETQVDIQACCPVCGDSHSGRKARLHLYNKSNSKDLTFVNCFNGGCPVENRTMFTFLRDFFPELLPNYKRETFQDRMLDLKTEFSGTSKNTFEDSSFISYIKDTSKVENAFGNIKRDNAQEPQEPKVTIQPKIKIETLQLQKVLKEFENTEAQEYLKSRGLEHNEKYGEFYYSQNDLILDDETLKIQNSIIVPCYYNNEIYGFYSRNINKKQFYTFIWKNTGYKIWNYFNQEPNKRTYVFEGVFDQMSSHLDDNNEANIIASMGQKISDERIKDIQEFGCEVVFVLDQDKTGLLNALEYAKRGFSVYVPPNNYKGKDINTLKLEYNLKPSEMRDIIKNNIFKGIQAQIKIKQLL